jgi:hypothetical protein
MNKTNMETYNMKFMSFFLTSVFAIALLCGCQSKRLPAGDIDIYTRYEPEISILKNPNIRAASKEKYEAACKLADGIDFTFLRQVATLNKLFTAKDAHIARQSEKLRSVIYYFNYEGKGIRFVFWCHNNVVIKAEIERRKE